MEKGCYKWESGKAPGRSKSRRGGILGGGEFGRER